MFVAIDSRSSSLLTQLTHWGGTCGPGGPGFGSTILLSSPEDSAYFSESVCLLRGQIEVFAATPEDVIARSKRGGLQEPLRLGRVGIRCVHCRNTPHESRSRGSVSYPLSTRLFDQAFRNWKRYHFPSCKHIPADVRQRVKALEGGPKRQYSSGEKKSSTKDYWRRHLERMGLVDYDDEDGVHFVARNDSGTNEGTANNPVVAGTVHEEVSDEGGEIFARVQEHYQAKDGIGTFSREFGTEVAETHVESSDVAHTQESSSVARKANRDDASPTSVVDQSMQVAHDCNAFHPEEQVCDIVSFGSCEDNGHGLDWLNLALSEFASNEIRDKGIGKSAIHDNALDRSQKSTRQELARHARGGPEALDALDGLDERKEHIMGLTRLAQDVVRTTSQMKVVAPMNNSTTALVHVPDGQYTQKDLFALGVDLYELFTNRHPFERKDNLDTAENVLKSMEALSPTSNSQQRKRERSAGNHAFIPLRELGFPVSLCTLISCLINPSGSPCPYESFEDVEMDLNTMISDPNRFLFDAAADEVTGFPLEFDSEGKLYGHEEQLSRLLDTVDHGIRSGGKNEVVMIKGYSGTGKSTLVHHAKKHLIAMGGFFVSGKFDLLQNVQPLSTIASAFNEYCNLLFEGDAEFLGEMRTAIQDAVGSNGKVLTDLIPGLKRIIGEQPATSSVASGRDAQNRLIFLLRVFARTISRPSHPLILFLDDLQWADSASLEVVRALVADPQTSYLFFVGCYRDNEVGSNHPADIFVREISRLGISVTSIEIGNINRDCVNDLISDMLHLLPRPTRPLAEMVFCKTSGNVMFVLQFLRSLYEEGLLRFSLSTRQWEWDLDAIQKKPIADDVAGLMAIKMKKLSVNVQEALKMAACLGTRFEASLLDMVSIESEGTSSVRRSLDVAVDEGLMYKHACSYMFSHDQIQQAAYSLIPIGERQLSHLQIGRLLWQGAPTVELDTIVFPLVDQLRRGSDLMTDHFEKVRFAELCLMAGEKAMATSSFLSASIYLLQGTALLDEIDWTNHYHLSLRLFSFCVEAQYVIGNYDGVMITSNPIWEHGRSLQDKLQAHHVMLLSLGTQDKLVSAVDYGLKILEQLGQSFPSKPSEDDMKGEIAKTQALMGNITVAGKDPTMGQMTDENMLAAMKLLYVCARYAYIVNCKIFSLMSCRMIQLSVAHGLCGDGVCGFALFGLALCMSGEYNQGSMYGRIAMSLLGRYDEKLYLARMNNIVYAMINVFSSPVQAGLPMIKHGHEVGMTVGDNEGALSSASIYVTHSIQSGSQLGPLAEEVKSIVQQHREYNYFLLLLTLLQYQTILNLMGDSEDPTVLTGDAMNEDEVLSIAREKQLTFIRYRFYHLRMWLAYLFRRFDVMTEIVDRHGTAINAMKKERPFRADTITFDTFYTGLAAVVLARESNEEDWRDIASEAVNSLKVWAEESSWNFQHKVELLSAEIAYYLDGDADRAGRSYDEAILLAGAHGFVHEQALACERAGIFYMNCGYTSVASDYFEQSCKWYRKWGAEKKAKDISENFLDFLGNSA